MQRSPVINTYNSNFAFWGKRDYIQGSHIIYGLLEAVASWGLGEVERFSASFRELLREDGKFLLFQEKNLMAPFREKLCSSFDVYTEKGTYPVGLEKDGRRVVKKLPDDEQSLISGYGLDVDGMFATVSGFPVGRLITVIIALNKKLHQRTFSSEGFGPWIVAMLDLHWKAIDFDMAKTIKVNILNNIGGKITKSIVEVDYNKVGEIYFNRRVH